MELTFDGMVAVVTGGSRGIGAAISLSLAGSGAKVVINHLPMDRDVEGFEAIRKDIIKIGGQCISVPGDITNSSFCNDLCRIAVEKYGGLDILVNSAGFAVQAGCSDISDDLWKNGIEVNLSAAFYTTRAALEYMDNSSRGRIIYIGSSGSITGGGGSAFYSAAKAGINGLVRNLSKELAPRGITVNAILPALIETDLLKDRHSDPEKRKTLVDRVPVGRLGQAEDVANAVIFLASDKAGFISGQLIIVDGGSTYK